MRHIKSDAPADVQAKAALAVVARLLPPNQSKLFKIQVNFDLPRNTFELNKNESSEIVFIKASSGVAACKGFYYYLKNYCNCHVSWEGSQLLTIPKVLPTINYKFTSHSDFIYYQNVCTWSYSFAWWKWADWQRHIDWMALNGIILCMHIRVDEIPKLAVILTSLNH